MKSILLNQKLLVQFPVSYLPGTFLRVKLIFFVCLFSFQVDLNPVEASSLSAGVLETLELLVPLNG